MDLQLQNKVAIVTGGSKGIGLGIVQSLIAEGVKVANVNRSETEGKALEAEYAKEGCECLFIQGDLTDTEACRIAVEKTLARFGRIDILVNLAGGMVQRRPLAEIDEEFFDKVMNLNLKSAYLTTRAVAPYMPAGGTILNFSSQAGRDGGGPGASIYATSKGAIMTFTRAMAKELGPLGVRVNALCPGMISTRFHDTFTKDEVRKNVAGSTPLRREGNPQEVAATVAFLVSEDAAFITGANIDINGGLAFS